MASSYLQQFAGGTLAHCDAQFPKTCAKCKRVYATFEAYVRDTHPIGTQPDFHDDDDPLGFLSLSSCACGSTIALRCEDPRMHREFLAALEQESTEHGVAKLDLLLELRDHVRALVSERADHAR